MSVSSALRAWSDPASSGSATATVAIPSVAARAEHAQRDLAAVRDQELAERLASHLRLDGHMRKMPKRVSGIGACSAAAIPSASTCRVSSGSMIPSSQSRAVE